MRDEEKARAEREATLFSPERARELLALAYGPLENTRKRSPFYGARKRQWKAAVVAATSCLGLHGHEADALVVAEALVRLAKFEGYTTYTVVDAREALAHLLARLPPGAAARTALAGHSCAHVRQAVAVSLEGTADDAAAAVPLLRLLASDHDASVRAAAHAAAPKGTLPPWLGVFDSDPTEAAVAWVRSRVEPAAAPRAEKKARALVAELCSTFVKERRISRCARRSTSRARRGTCSTTKSSGRRPRSVRLTSRPRWQQWRRVTRKLPPRSGVRCLARPTRRCSKRGCRWRGRTQSRVYRRRCEWVWRERIAFLV